MVNNLMDNILNRIKDLPPLPDSVQKIIEITNSHKASATDLSKVLERDQALTSKILKLVNSSYYGFSREITTISQATMLLGFNTIKSLALTATSYNLLNRNLPAYEMEKGMLWQHSIACATACRLIAKQIKYPNPEEAYISGLIHDIGKLMLDQYASDLFKQIITLTTTSEIPFDIAEKEILGFDHAQIGGKIAENWNFPITLVEAISHHHQPEEAKQNQTLTYIVHLADTITEMIGIGIGNDSLKYAFQPDTLTILNLGEELVQSLILQLSELMNAELIKRKN